MELRIEMEDWEGNVRVARYDSFQVGNISSLYRLSVSGFSGNDGDSLSYHNGMAFSTKDKDNDNHWRKHCARDFDGGWWFHQCLEVNLNGVHYLEERHNENGIVWKTFHNETYSLKGVRMLLRHKHFNMLKIVAQQLCGLDDIDVNEIEFPVIRLTSPVTTAAPMTTTTPVPTTSCPACPKCLTSEQFYRHVLPKSCADLWLMNKRRNGIFKIFPDGIGPIWVYCDMTTDEGGWTVFQRRKEAKNGEAQVDFVNRGWNDYVDGFGDKNGSFWLGLDSISKLTESGNTELRIELEDWDGIKKFAKYDVFEVGQASDNYKLLVGGYSGNAGNSFQWNSGMQFTTIDRDNDKDTVNCADRWKSGGWWYRSCSTAYLNGKYGRKTSNGGIKWFGFHPNDANYSLKRVEMKLRETDFIDN